MVESQAYLGDTNIRDQLRLNKPATATDILQTFGQKQRFGRDYSQAEPILDEQQYSAQESTNKKLNEEKSANTLQSAPLKKLDSKSKLAQSNMLLANTEKLDTSQKQANESNVSLSYAARLQLNQHMAKPVNPAIEIQQKGKLSKDSSKQMETKMESRRLFPQLEEKVIVNERYTARQEQIFSKLKRAQTAKALSGQRRPRPHINSENFASDKFQRKTRENSRKQISKMVGTSSYSKQSSNTFANQIVVTSSNNLFGNLMGSNAGIIIVNANQNTAESNSATSIPSDPAPVQVCAERVLKTAGYYKRHQIPEIQNTINLQAVTNASSQKPMSSRAGRNIIFSPSSATTQAPLSYTSTRHLDPHHQPLNIQQVKHGKGVKLTQTLVNNLSRRANSGVQNNLRPSTSKSGVTLRRFEQQLKRREQANIIQQQINLRLSQPVPVPSKSVTRQQTPKIQIEQQKSHQLLQSHREHAQHYQSHPHTRTYDDSTARREKEKATALACFVCSQNVVSQLIQAKKLDMPIQQPEPPNQHQFAEDIPPTVIGPSEPKDVNDRINNNFTLSQTLANVCRPDLSPESIPNSTEDPKTVAFNHKTGFSEITDGTQEANSPIIVKAAPVNISGSLKSHRTPIVSKTNLMRSQNNNLVASYQAMHPVTQQHQILSEASPAKLTLSNLQSNSPPIHEQKQTVSETTTPRLPTNHYGQHVQIIDSKIKSEGNVVSEADQHNVQESITTSKDKNQHEILVTPREKLISIGQFSKSTLHSREVMVIGNGVSPEKPKENRQDLSNYGRRNSSHVVESTLLERTPQNLQSIYQMPNSNLTMNNLDVQVVYRPINQTSIVPDDIPLQINSGGAQFLPQSQRSLNQPKQRVVQQRKLSCQANACTTVRQLNNAEQFCGILRMTPSVGRSGQLLYLTQAATSQQRTFSPIGSDGQKVELPVMGPGVVASDDKPLFVVSSRQTKNAPGSTFCQTGNLWHSSTVVVNHRSDLAKRTLVKISNGHISPIESQARRRSANRYRDDKQQFELQGQGVAPQEFHLKRVQSGQSESPQRLLRVDNVIDVVHTKMPDGDNTDNEQRNTQIDMQPDQERIYHHGPSVLPNLMTGSANNVSLKDLAAQQEQSLGPAKQMVDRGQSCSDLPVSAGHCSEDFFTNALVSPKLRKSSNKVIFSVHTGSKISRDQRPNSHKQAQTLSAQNVAKDSKRGSRVSGGAIRESGSRSPGRIRKSRTGEEQHNQRTHIIAEKLMIDSSDDDHKISSVEQSVDPPQEIYVSNSKLTHGAMATAQVDPYIIDRFQIKTNEEKIKQTATSLETRGGKTDLDGRDSYHRRTHTVNTITTQNKKKQSQTLTTSDEFKRRMENADQVKLGSMDSLVEQVGDEVGNLHSGINSLGENDLQKVNFTQVQIRVRPDHENQFLTKSSHGVRQTQMVAAETNLRIQHSEVNLLTNTNQQPQLTRSSGSQNKTNKSNDALKTYTVVRQTEVTEQTKQHYSFSQHYMRRNKSSQNIKGNSNGDLHKTTSKENLSNYQQAMIEGKHGVKKLSIGVQQTSRHGKLTPTNQDLELIEQHSKQCGPQAAMVQHTQTGNRHAKREITANITHIRFEGNQAKYNYDFPTSITTPAEKHKKREQKKKLKSPQRTKKKQELLFTPKDQHVPENCDTCLSGVREVAESQEYLRQLYDSHTGPHVADTLCRVLKSETSGSGGQQSPGKLQEPQQQSRASLVNTVPLGGHHYDETGSSYPNLDFSTTRPVYVQNRGQVSNQRPYNPVSYLQEHLDNIETSRSGLSSTQDKTPTSQNQVKPIAMRIIKPQVYNGNRNLQNTSSQKETNQALIDSHSSTQLLLKKRMEGYRSQSELTTGQQLLRGRLDSRPSVGTGNDNARDEEKARIVLGGQNNLTPPLNSSSQEEQTPQNSRLVSRGQHKSPAHTKAQKKKTKKQVNVKKVGLKERSNTKTSHNNDSTMRRKKQLEISKTEKDEIIISPITSPTNFHHRQQEFQHHQHYEKSPRQHTKSGIKSQTPKHHKTLEISQDMDTVKKLRLSSKRSILDMSMQQKSAQKMHTQMTQKDIQRLSQEFAKKSSSKDQHDKQKQDVQQSISVGIIPSSRQKLAKKNEEVSSVENSQIAHNNNQKRKGSGFSLNEQSLQTEHPQPKTSGIRPPREQKPIAHGDTSQQQVTAGRDTILRDSEFMVRHDSNASQKNDLPMPRGVHSFGKSPAAFVQIKLKKPDKTIDTPQEAQELNAQNSAEDNKQSLAEQQLVVTNIENGVGTSVQLSQLVTRDQLFENNIDLQMQVLEEHSSAEGGSVQDRPVMKQLVFTDSQQLVRLNNYNRGQYLPNSATITSSHTKTNTRRSAAKNTTVYWKPDGCPGDSTSNIFKSSDQPLKMQFNSKADLAAAKNTMQTGSEVMSSMSRPMSGINITKDSNNISRHTRSQATEGQWRKYQQLNRFYKSRHGVSLTHIQKGGPPGAAKRQRAASASQNKMVSKPPDVSQVDDIPAIRTIEETKDSVPIFVYNSREEAELQLQRQTIAIPTGIMQQQSINHMLYAGNVSINQGSVALQNKLIPHESSPQRLNSANNGRAHLFVNTQRAGQELSPMSGTEQYPSFGDQTPCGNSLIANTPTYLRKPSMTNNMTQSQKVNFSPVNFQDQQRQVKKTRQTRKR